MPNLVAIGGLPAVGKTTLIRNFFLNYKTWYKIKYKKLYGHFNKELHLVILGVYKNNEIFSGTDKLSMAVQPDFAEFLVNNKPKYNVLFEGDRLFNMKTISIAQEYMNVKIYILHSNNTFERHLERKDNQSEKFIKSRLTKLTNIKNLLDNKYEILVNDNNNDLEKNYKTILNNFTQRLKEEHGETKKI